MAAAFGVGGCSSEPVLRVLVQPGSGVRELGRQGAAFHNSCLLLIDQIALLCGLVSWTHCRPGGLLGFVRSAFWCWEAPESYSKSGMLSPQEHSMCRRAPSVLSLLSLCSCSHTKPSAYMEHLEGVCQEPAANSTNQESWLAGGKTLTL